MCLCERRNRNRDGDSTASSLDGSGHRLPARVVSHGEPTTEPASLALQSKGGSFC